MMRLFDRDGAGAQEIVAAVGVISNSITFDKWAPLLPLGVRDVTAIVGRDPVEALARYYNDYEPGPVDMHAPPTVSTAGRGILYLAETDPDSRCTARLLGRSRRIGENERGLTALEQFKDEENILRLAYEATDALVEALEPGQLRLLDTTGQVPLCATGC